MSKNGQYFRPSEGIFDSPPLFTGLNRPTHVFQQFTRKRLGQDLGNTRKPKSPGQGFETISKGRRGVTLQSGSSPGVAFRLLHNRMGWHGRKIKPNYSRILEGGQGPTHKCQIITGGHQHHSLIRTARRDSITQSRQYGSNELPAEARGQKSDSESGNQTLTSLVQDPPHTNSGRMGSDDGAEGRWPLLLDFRPRRLHSGPENVSSPVAHLSTLGTTLSRRICQPWKRIVRPVHHQVASLASSQNQCSSLRFGG